ncbi:hypothetical protein SKAU_G00311060 [Synaphobranchus kaupii]|uniref:Uncharacterized protein n=1 Tax=Synaphobranchus kaupii TaxID=118154 RepID=A0A9Q1ERT8_SYNKA|nr:hypothetical protein SKAU_G00311060 [Synaphobranchus kaupii]
MDILQESALLPTEENSVKVQDAEWNVCQTPDRRHADALLNISEDSFAKEGDAYELSIESGWEEAIHGWVRSPPLACLFQNQKKKHRGSGLHWSSQPSKNLRFALGIQTAKRRDPPLNFAGDLLPRTGYRLVRNMKYEDLSRLPALLGTRVPLPAPSHRLL